MQLYSKMRFISTQFHAYITNELWKKNAEHANQMTKYFEQKLRTFTELQITRPVDANAIFVKMPLELINRLKKEYYFYIWDEKNSEIRLMTSFETTTDQIDQFISFISSQIRELQK